MTTLSNDFLSLAEELVSLFGTEGVWSLRQYRPIVDKNDPTDPGQVDHTDTAINIAITAWEDNKYDNLNILYGDQMGILPARAGYPIPCIGDALVTFDSTGNVSKTYKLVPPVIHHSANGIVVAYQINLRG